MPSLSKLADQIGYEELITELENYFSSDELEDFIERTRALYDLEEEE